MAKSSQLPNGGLVPTLGSNYMMDGYQFDGGYGEGVDSARKFPAEPRSQREQGLEMPRSNSGLAGLPDGFANPMPEDEFPYAMVQASDEESGVGGISEFAKNAARLSDLHWLEGAVQDPARLPENINLLFTDKDEFGRTTIEDVPESGTRPELESAWGVNRRTDGQNIVPNVEYPRPVTPPVSMIGGDQFRLIVAHAMRQSAFGKTLKEITREVLAFLGPDPMKLDGTPGMRALTAAMRTIKAEHGLVGNVYVRDSAFPKILSGKWDSTIRTRCASAHYFLTTPGSKLSAYENYLGKKVVTSIPWAEAMDHYRPIFAAKGQKLASGDPRRALYAAFTGRPARESKATNFPKYVPRVASEKEAADALANVRKPEAVPVKNASSNLLKKAHARLERWVKAGVMTEARANELRASIQDPWELFRTASEEVATAGHQQYKGASFSPHQAASSASVSNPLEVRQLLRWASVQMSEGMAGKELDYLLNARFSQDMLKQASEPLVQLRKKREGLSGHLYVDASAYASVDGTAGCEKGALLHRANAIKAVLGMDRCASCTANVDGACQKYNKVIVASAPTKDPAKYAAEMIRLAGVEDRTASFFAPSYDSNEYDLRNDNLDDLEYRNTPPAENLGDILFDGMLVDMGEGEER